MTLIRYGMTLYLTDIKDKGLYPYSAAPGKDADELPYMMLEHEDTGTEYGPDDPNVGQLCPKFAMQLSYEYTTIYLGREMRSSCTMRPRGG